MSAEELVVGDIVTIKAGYRVPADIRLLTVDGLHLDTAQITGEVDPIEMTDEASAKHVSLFDSRNIAFNGAYCVDGCGLGVVIRTGDKTVGCDSRK
jgi:sodium/potassium-transporting ATPase subunit alpha